MRNFAIGVFSRIGRIAAVEQLPLRVSSLPAVADKKKYVDFDVCASTAAAFHT
jgi:hypothetical protein